MSNPVLPVDRYEAKESGRALQSAQHDVMSAGSKATLAMLRELLKILQEIGQMSQKSAQVKITINDRVAYQGTVDNESSNSPNNNSAALSEEQLLYLKEVLRLPESDQLATANLPLDKDLTISIDGREVLRLKNGVVEKNVFAATPQQTSVQPPRAKPILKSKSNRQEQPAQVAQVEVVGADISSPSHLKQAGVSPSQQPEKAEPKPPSPPPLIQNSSSPTPIVLVLHREVERNLGMTPLKNNLQSSLAGLHQAFNDFSQNVSSLLGSLRDKFFSPSPRSLGQDLQNLAVVNVASKLLERFGGKTESGKQVFDTQSFRLERQGNNLSLIAKDGRGTILSLNDGELRGSLTSKDVERFRAVEGQLGQGKSRQSQAEIG